MTEIEERELQELSAELAGAMQSPWQPRTVARAFATRAVGEIVFTLQHWIDLDAARSPILTGELPANREETEAMFRVFGLDLGEPEEAELICAAIEQEIAEAFAAALPMRAEQAAEGEDDGFGEWAPIFACLVSQCGLGRGEALATPVAQAFVLIATHRANQGWRVAGTPYAVRDVGEEAGSQKSEEEKEAARG